MRISRLPQRLLLIAVILVAAGAIGVPTTSARRASISAKSITSICAKRAYKATRHRLRASTTAAGRRKRRAALRRRCIVRFARTATRGKYRHEVASAVVAEPATTSNVESTTSATPSEPLVIGIDGGYFEWNSEEVAMRAALGAAVTRHEWDITQPVNAQDALVYKAAAEVHTRIHALLGSNNLGDPTHYREWVVAFIRRYGIGGSFWSEHPELDASRYAITTFELGNEPYYGGMSAAEYADAVRPTLEQIAQLGLPAKVVLPGYVYGTNTSWIDTLYQRIPNLNSLFYAFAEHPYWYGHDPAEPGPAGPFERISELRRRMNELGATEKPIFITEYGESTANCGSECVTEAVQAEHLKEMIEAVASRTDWKVGMLSIFQLHDWATNSTEREKQFGILRQDGTPKPAYSIVSAAIQQYRG